MPPLLRIPCISWGWSPAGGDRTGTSGGNTQRAEQTRTTQSAPSIDDALADHRADIPQHYFVADSFLKPGTTSRFVGDAESIQNDIEEAFRATTGDELPKDIQITI